MTKVTESVLIMTSKLLCLIICTQDQKASYDFNDMDADPKPRDSDPDNW